MRLCRSISDFRAEIASFREAGQSVGLVTTMGALHAGHMALVTRARAECDRVVTTIFVNPTQFGQAADLDNYPRTEEADLALFASGGVDAVLIPTVEQMYPPGDETIVETTGLANVLHGQVRPGHFRGVATVVTKLFNIAGADRAYFGEKDYQQLAVIRRMARDLHVPTAVVGVPTVREDDGLAMSSRNVRLSPEHRKEARILYRVLTEAEEALTSGRITVAGDLAAMAGDMVHGETSGRLRAFDMVDPATFIPITGRIIGPVAIMMSVEFGSGDDTVLLIDQKEITP
ncbi:pantoate--beta-alanine ligase [Alphaproteobacteria bacterium GH1-50]|uniref:Pantothenate synthetase n=1 Tax=Kangsaoukella pontilimi TaxID=2691042 RepID=A0A7C9J5K3_9RHOB|nr:pantoate--beta-alanine ligase [Kangsaoukella pontilimi]MXQ09421.1 pantoate--beta-alanine ligase [Kangsaoukella pontilimi]